VLDMNLRGEMAIGVADRLMADNVPFLIATGYGQEMIPDRFAAVPRIEKPFAVAEAIAILARFGEASRLAKVIQ
jgi:hypothetical protein